MDQNSIEKDPKSYTKGTNTKIRGFSSYESYSDGSKKYPLEDPKSRVVKYVLVKKIEENSLVLKDYAENKKYARKSNNIKQKHWFKNNNKTVNVVKQEVRIPYVICDKYGKKTLIHKLHRL